MSTQTTARATIDDLYKVEGKAELIGGSIVTYMASGYLPIAVAANIYTSLHAYARRTKAGIVGTYGLGYAVKELASGRESFSPDASFYSGPLPSNLMRFIEGPPTFAAEVRSENDYGKSAEDAMADKRADYFAAGTRVVWDVDPEAESIFVYRADAPATPVVLHRGDTADAEPAVPGWRIAVDDVFVY